MSKCLIKTKMKPSQRTGLASVLMAALLISLPLADAAGRRPLEVASPFVDGAILQREMNVPVWGWAEPGSVVTVAFADQSKTATAGEKGKWMVTLDPLEASHDERELKVTSDGEAITRSGVLVGEVWFSSGQSNMDWIASKSMCRALAGEVQRAKNEVPVREYTVDTGSSLYSCSRAASANRSCLRYSAPRSAREARVSG